MAARSDSPPLIVIVGETASGKTALAIELAQKFNGEIIAADSRTLYRGMDIGTAKPSKSEQSAVRHHAIDVANPNEPITAAAYKRMALRAIEDITDQGKIPFLVGGAGLYINSILYDYAFSDSVIDETRRYELSLLSVDELQARLKRARIPLPSNARNPRHLVRQLETGGVSNVRKDLRTNTLLLGIQSERSELHERITKRVKAMFAEGLEGEVRQLVKLHGWIPVLETIGYQEFCPYLEGRVSLDEVYSQIVRGTMQYAKRQRAWFRRNKDIVWISKKDDAVDLVTTFLNK